MKDEQFAKLKKILSATPDTDKALKIYTDAGIVTAEEAEELSDELSLSEKHYDCEGLKKAILSQIPLHQLKDLEVEPGQYHLIVDTLADEEAGLAGIVEYLGPENLEGISFEDEDGTEDPQADIEEYCARLADDLNDQLDLPGLIDFGYNDGSFDMNFYFIDSDLPELEQLGSEFGKVEGSVSFTEIVAALEETGLHDAAKQLHRILRETKA